MRTPTKAFFLAIIIASTLLLSAAAQTGSNSQQGGGARKRSSRTEAKPSEEQQETEVIKIDSHLVTVPVIASDRNDIYVPDLRQDEFTIYEDEVKQELAFFATTKAPFQVILMLDTSASTEEKLGQIQRAATAFVEQLQPADRIKIISFDDQVRELSGFTNNREALRAAIQKARAGQGTKLYDAMQLALNTLRRVQGRKAIVLFSDGVDWHSDTARFDDNIRMLEESGVIVYPIRYDTREETERIARQNEGQIADPRSIYGGGTPRSTTPSTFPGGDPIPGGGGMGRQQPSLGLPMPPVMVRRPRTDPYPGGSPYPDRRTDPYPGNDPYPSRRNDPYPGNDPYPSRRDDPISAPRRGREDSVGVMLDGIYNLADQYLNTLVTTSGGKLHRADTLGSLPTAFARIAAELRTQYSLGYYPSNRAHDGSYRNIKVRVSRKDVVVRAKPGYRAQSGA